MKIVDIIQRAPFDQIFPRSFKVLHDIEQSIKTIGYDEAHPITVWRGENVCLDGHQRLYAMRLHKRKEILVELKDFKSEDDALDYALHEQRDRRNLTDGDILSAIELIDKRMARGAADGFRGNQHTGGNSGKGASQPSPETNNTAKLTAQKLGISAAKVKKARTIIDRAMPEIKAMISGNEITINRYAQEAWEIIFSTYYE